MAASRTAFRRPSGQQATPPTGPAVTLLDALRRGDWAAALAVLSPDARLTAPELGHASTGSEAIGDLAAEALARFPDLSYQPHTRRAGPHLIVDEGFVTGTNSAGPGATGRSMTATVKVSAHHDEHRVHQLVVEVDAAALMQALGRPVDPAAAAYSQVQGLRADMHTGLSTYAIAPATVVRPPVPPPTAPRAGRRRRVVVGGLLAALVVSGGVATMALSDDEAPPVAASASTPEEREPTRTRTRDPEPEPTPRPKPSVVLSADLAFDPNSAKLSRSARTVIARIARRAVGLDGVIRVDGYADRVGTARSSLVISRKRAAAVADVLRATLGEQDRLRIEERGHGEADPVASNATADGRAQNRRVEITLPRG